ncbi:hypothetical protein ACFLY2_02410 [Patescibacteria group bacterium]
MTITVLFASGVVTTVSFVSGVVTTVSFTSTASIFIVVFVSVAFTSTTLALVSVLVSLHHCNQKRVAIVKTPIFDLYNKLLSILFTIILLLNN